jgi:hypothetical protein
MDVTVLLCTFLAWLCYHIVDEIGTGRFVGSIVWLQSTGIVGGLVLRRLDGLRRDVVKDGWMRTRVGGSLFGFTKRDNA